MAGTVPVFVEAVRYGLTRPDLYTYVNVRNHPVVPDCDAYPLHRLVVESYLGERLSSWNVVHHINEDTHDNRIENLIAFVDDNAHIAWHRGHSMFRYAFKPGRKTGKYGYPKLGIILYGPALAGVKQQNLKMFAERTKRDLGLM